MASIPPRFFGPRYWPTWLGLAFLRLVEFLPFATLLAVGRGVGHLARRLPLPYTHIARCNIALCLPELSPAEEAELTEAFVRVRAALVTAAVAAGRARLTVCRLARKRGVDRGR
jgi:KDO2-lipid IV(A) lauroyltransferase